MELYKNKNVDTTQTTTHIGLCAGYGGIELGLQRVIPNLRSVALCEIEAFACANLVAKMEAGLLDAAPIWTDLKTFPWAEFRDRVDILTGGYPCQPFSAAGKRAGQDDPRHLWPYIARGIRILRPRICFFENVEGHISLGLSDVIEDLAGLGYRTTWGIFSASEVGAPHQRKRVFILGLADSASGRWGQCGKGFGCIQVFDQRSAWPSRPGEPQHGWEPPRVVANSLRSRGEEPEHLDADIPTEPSGCDTEGVGNTEGGASIIKRSKQSEEWSGIAAAGAAMGNSSRQRCEQNAPLRGEQQPSGSSEERGSGVAEAMGDTAKQGFQGGAGEVIQRPIQRPSNDDREQKDYADGQAQPPLGRDSDGAAGGMDYAELCVSCDNRTDELRLLGNGVVPATAEKAFRVLSEELCKNNALHPR
jgi:DNA (cytosine-5)-methyltransferase 1